MSTTSPFTVRLTADFFCQGKPRFEDIGLGAFDDHPQIHYDFFKEHTPEILPEQINGAQGIIVLTPAVTRASLTDASETLVIGRFGVGYESVDVQACTEADVAVFITAGAVDRSVAEATLGWMLALSHNMLIKDRLVRTGAWDARSRHMGSELRDRTLGVIGCGGIARKLIELARGFGMRQPLAFDPFLDKDKGEEIGVSLVTLEALLSTADFVSLHCPLTEATRGMIGEHELAMMKPSAYLLNTARGGIVQEDALLETLKLNRIAGAALDCFAEEPVTHPHKCAALDNVILAPHSIAWTNELFRDIGLAAATGIIKVAQGRCPHGLLNPEVYGRAGFQEKLRKYQWNQ